MFKIYLSKALAFAKTRVHPQTGYYHGAYCLQVKEDAGLIPIYENFLYALLLLHSKEAQNILRARELIKALLSYQDETGCFPYYLHQKEQKGSFQGKMHLVFKRLLSFEVSLGAVYKEIEKAFERFQKENKPLSIEGEPSSYFKISQLYLEHFEKEAFDQYWDSLRCVWVLPAKRDKMWRAEPLACGGDVLKALSQGTLPKRALYEHPHLLLAGLFPPTISKEERKEVSRFSYSHFDQKALQDHPERYLHFPFQVFWGDEKAVKSLSLHAPDTEVKLLRAEGAHFTFRLTMNEPLDEDKSNESWLTLYLSHSGGDLWLKEGKKSNTFKQEECLEGQLSGMTLKLSFSGDLTGVGRVMLGPKGKVHQDLKAVEAAVEEGVYWKLPIQTLTRPAKGSLELSLSLS